jgi:hypothetical protein
MGGMGYGGYNNDVVIVENGGCNIFFYLVFGRKE